MSDTLDTTTDTDIEAEVEALHAEVEKTKARNAHKVVYSAKNVGSLPVLNPYDEHLGNGRTIHHDGLVAKFDERGLCELDLRIDKQSRIAAILDEMIERGPEVEPAVRRYGVKRVDLTIGLPIPFSTWDDTNSIDDLRTTVRALRLDIDTCLAYETAKVEPRDAVLAMLLQLRSTKKQAGDRFAVEV